MTKNELRAKYKSLRQSLSDIQIEDLSIAISNNLLKMPIWDHSFYHVFLSIHKLMEVNTEPILSVLSGKDKNIVVSKTHFKSLTLSHFLLTDSTVIKVNHWGIPEPVDGTETSVEINPEKINVVFVPLLAFDKQGNRVGYGKGFYDTFLSECKPDTIKIGISFFESEEKIEGITENDVKLDFCVTPKKIYEF